MAFTGSIASFYRAFEQPQKVLVEPDIEPKTGQNLNAFSSCESRWNDWRYEH
jgi:hypothetical protein